MSHSELTIHEDDAGVRLDRFLRKLLPGAGLGFIQKLCRKGVRRNGVRAKASDRLAPGDRLRIALAPEELERLRVSKGEAGKTRPRSETPSRSRPGAPPPPLQVLFEDGDILVLNKPTGLLVHSGPEGEEDLCSMVRRYLPVGPSLTFRPSPAHRLDRETSGLVVFGKTAAALRALTQSLRKGLWAKAYLALLAGRPDPSMGVLLGRLRRGEPGGRRKARVRVVGKGAEGKEARLQYRLVAAAQGASLVAVRLETGRTHQIRVQFEAHGCPLVRDPRYGGRRCGGLPFFLHAAKLLLPHPSGAKLLQLEAPPPPGIRDLLQDAGLWGDPEAQLDALVQPPQGERE